MSDKSQNTTYLPILISGLPRSGTTWVGQVLSTANNVKYIFEPDNAKISAIGMCNIRKIPRFPRLNTNETHELESSLLMLWAKLLRGDIINGKPARLVAKLLKKASFDIEAEIGNSTGFQYLQGFTKDTISNRSANPSVINLCTFLACTTNAIANLLFRAHSRRVIIKSVHSSFILPFLYQHLEFRLLTVLRSPFALYSSYLRMNMGDSWRNINLPLPKQHPPLIEIFDFIAWQICAGMKEQIDHSRLINEPVIWHEDLCSLPHEKYKVIYSHLNLEWTDETESIIRTLDQEGTGFVPSRVASKEVGKWKTFLDLGHQKRILSWVDAFELTDELPHGELT